MYVISSFLLPFGDTNTCLHLVCVVFSLCRCVWPGQVGS